MSLKPGSCDMACLRVGFSRMAWRACSIFSGLPSTSSIMSEFIISCFWSNHQAVFCRQNCTVFVAKALQCYFRHINRALAIATTVSKLLQQPHCTCCNNCILFVTTTAPHMPRQAYRIWPNNRVVFSPTTIPFLSQQPYCACPTKNHFYYDTYTPSLCFIYIILYSSQQLYCIFPNNQTVLVATTVSF